MSVRRYDLHDLERAKRRARRRQQEGGFGFRFGSGAAYGAGALDPATLAMDGYWRGSYTPANSNWVGTASTGASSGRDLTYVSGGAGVASAENGYTPIDCGATRIEGANLSTYSPANTPFSGFVLVRPDAVTTLARFWGTTAGGATAPSLTVTTGTVKFADGVDITSVGTISTATWVAIFFGFTGALTWLKVGTAARVTSATVVTAGRAATFRPFSNVGSDPYDGRCMEMGFTAVQLSDLQTERIRTYFGSRYAMAGI